MLPDESKYVLELAKQLEEQFDYSRTSLAEGVAITDGPIEFRKAFHVKIELAATGLHVLMCRRFRQVIALCKLGQVDCAEGVCRSMFEGLLVQKFICLNSVSLRRENSRKKVNTHGKKLTQVFRATLYVAHDTVQWNRTLNKMAKIPRRKRYTKRKLKEQADDYAEHCREVGPGWAKALRENTCAGLSIQDFAYSFGKHIYDWFVTLYKIQCGFVHGGQYSISLDFSRPGKPPRLKWQDKPEEVFRALRTANYLHGLEQTEFNRLLDKTHAPYIEAGLFRDATSELRRVFNF